MIPAGHEHHANGGLFVLGRLPKEAEDDLYIRLCGSLRHELAINIGVLEE